MTTNDRIHDQGFCYDDAVPLSVPAGQPLRAPHQDSESAPTTRVGIRRSCRQALASLRARLAAGD